MSTSIHVDEGETEVRVILPNAVLRVIDDLATRKGLTRTEALIQSVVTTKAVADLAPHGAVVTPMPSNQLVLHTHHLRI